MFKFELLDKVAKLHVTSDLRGGDRCHSAFLLTNDWFHFHRKEGNGSGGGGSNITFVVLELETGYRVHSGRIRESG